MSVQTIATTCESITPINPNLYELIFTKPADFHFLPGQFVLWHVPTNSGTTIPRAYSIASHTSENVLRFYVSYKPGGIASEWIKHTLKIGTPCTMVGPMGNFTCVPTPNIQYLFIATGTGLAPFLPILQEFITVEPNMHGTVLICNRSEQDFFALTQLQTIQNALPNLNILYTCTKPSETWRGSTGRVQVHLPNILKNKTNVQVYACGNPQMTKEVKALCIQEYGLDVRAVHVEGFI